MNILIDLHHEDLFYSLQLLFEKRLKYNVYRPIGLDWYHEGYWHIYPHVNTANQYLSTESIPPLSANGISVTEEHGEGAWINKGADGGPLVYEIPDKQHANPINHRGITLEGFQRIHFDIVLCSIPNHIKPFQRLISRYQPHAKFIFQAGNNWGGIKTKNLLTSSKTTYSVIPESNTVFYHQEFDTSVFRPGPCKNPRSIISLQHLSDSIDRLNKLKKYLPAWTIKAYGAGMPYGPVPSLDIPQLLRDIGFVWHVKKNEGYGYNIHHAFASGKPMIVEYQANQGMTPADLYKLDLTVLDCNQPLEQMAKKLEHMANIYDMYSQKVYNQFINIVDFDKEEIAIRKFIENLQ